MTRACGADDILEYSLLRRMFRKLRFQMIDDTDSWLARNFGSSTVLEGCSCHASVDHVVRTVSQHATTRKFAKEHLRATLLALLARQVAPPDTGAPTTSDTGGGIGCC